MRKSAFVASIILASGTLIFPNMAFAVGPNFPTSSPVSVVTSNPGPSVPNDSTLTTYEAESQRDGSVLVSIENGRFELHGDHVVIINNKGEVLETLPKTLVDNAGNRFSAEYKIITKSKLQVRQHIPAFGFGTDRSSWGGYGKCIVKNAAGGVVGGAAGGCLDGYLAPAPEVCATGAATGAAVVGVAATVGSLFWCW